MVDNSGLVLMAVKSNAWCGPAACLWGSCWDAVGGRYLIREERDPVRFGVVVRPGLQ